jgi:hypothetical protein
MNEPTFYPGTKVLVFDRRLYVDDIVTPLSLTMKEATVLRWYGTRPSRSSASSTYPGKLPGPPYDSLIDVVFAYDSWESRGHFTYYTKIIG